MAGITVAVTHSKVLNGLADDTNPNEVHPSDWNASHGVTVTGQNERSPAQASSVNILSTDIEVGIDTSGGAVTVNLPIAAAWATANPFGNELVIQDITGNAATNNITPSLNGGDTFRGGSAPVISTAYGIMKLRPANNPVTGWKITGLN